MDDFSCFRGDFSSILFIFISLFYFTITQPVSLVGALLRVEDKRIYVHQYVDSTFLISPPEIPPDFIPTGFHPHTHKCERQITEYKHTKRNNNGPTNVNRHCQEPNTTPGRDTRNRDVNGPTLTNHCSKNNQSCRIKKKKKKSTSFDWL